MRILHVSDTHVGFANYARISAAGLNQREEDFFGAFSRAIDLAIEKRVDVVLHSGDVFDSVRPTNRAIGHVLAECVRLREARIPIVVISGNHEAPRLRETGAVLRLLDFIPGVHAVYKGTYENVRIGDLAVHAIPHAADNDALQQEIAKAQRDDAARYHVAMLHAGIVGVGDFRTGEFHEQVVDQGQLPKDMDYVALGHYHRAVEIAPRVWYAGSTERSTFKECGETKSVNLVDLARGTVEPIPLDARPMIDLPPVRCEGMQDVDIAPAVLRRLADVDMKDAIVRLRVLGIPRHVYTTIDHAKVRALTAEALHFEPVYEIVQTQAAGLATESVRELGVEFEAFLSQRTLTGNDRSALLAEAQALLRDASNQEVA